LRRSRQGFDFRGPDDTRSTLLILVSLYIHIYACVRACKPSPSRLGRPFAHFHMVHLDACKCNTSCHCLHLYTSPAKVVWTLAASPRLSSLEKPRRTNIFKKTKKARQHTAAGRSLLHVPVVLSASQKTRQHPSHRKLNAGHKNEPAVGLSRACSFCPRAIVYIWNTNRKQIRACLGID
jgi:hypothetical protein